MASFVGKITPGQLARYREQHAYFHLVTQSSSVEFELPEAVKIIVETYEMENDLLRKHELEPYEVYSICPVTGGIFAVEPD